MRAGKMKIATTYRELQVGMAALKIPCAMCGESVNAYEVGWDNRKNTCYVTQKCHNKHYKKIQFSAYEMIEFQNSSEMLEELEERMIGGKFRVFIARAIRKKEGAA